MNSLSGTGYLVRLDGSCTKILPAIPATKQDGEYFNTSIIQKSLHWVMRVPKFARLIITSEEKEMKKTVYLCSYGLVAMSFSLCASEASDTPTTEHLDSKNSSYVVPDHSVPPSTPADPWEDWDED